MGSSKLTKLMRRLRRRSWQRPEPVASRRRFLLQGALLLGAGFVGLPRLLRRQIFRDGRPGPPLRPPTADPDDAKFRAACIRCGLCGTVCENGCIRTTGLDDLEHGPGTPYLDVRRRSCTLCMGCTSICPTSALTAVPRESARIIERVRIGTAVVDPDRCLSHLGRVCGYCHDACPYPGVAIRLVSAGKPEILADGCVGCGRCVELCPQVPTAIDVWRSSA